MRAYWISILERLKKYCSHSVLKDEDAVFLVFGFRLRQSAVAQKLWRDRGYGGQVVLAQLQGFSNLRLRQSLAKNKKSSLRIGYIISLTALACFFSAMAFAAEPPKPSIIPAPQKMEVTQGQFKLTPTTRIVVDRASAETGAYLAAKLRASTGYPFPIQTNDEAGMDAIQITTQGAGPELEAEGYHLDIHHLETAGTNEPPAYALIVARTQAGAFYGVQTLLQLLPPQIFSTNVGPWRFVGNPMLSPYRGSTAFPMARIHARLQPAFLFEG